MDYQESDRRIRDWFIRQEASAAIGRWIDQNIDENGNEAFHYVYKISRNADIADLIKEATEKVDKMDLSNYSITEDGPDHFMVRMGNTTKRCFRGLFP